MTTTKIAYVVAAIVPFGLVALACYGIAHVAWVGLRERKAKTSGFAKSLTPPPTRVRSRVWFSRSR